MPPEEEGQSSVLGTTSQQRRIGEVAQRERDHERNRRCACLPWYGSPPAEQEEPEPRQADHTVRHQQIEEEVVRVNGPIGRRQPSWCNLRGELGEGRGATVAEQPALARNRQGQR